MKALNMNGQTHAFKRDSVYYFRMKVPVDLLPHYSPKTEIRFSLKTSDKKEARRLANQEARKTTLHLCPRWFSLIGQSEGNRRKSGHRVWEPDAERIRFLAGYLRLRR